MKCQFCQFENPEGVKFCVECGCEIKLVCPQCSFANPPHFKFCGECGTQLAAQETSQPKELSIEEKLDKIQRPSLRNLVLEKVSSSGKL